MAAQYALRIRKNSMKTPIVLIKISNCFLIYNFSFFFSPLNGIVIVGIFFAGIPLQLPLGYFRYFCAKFVGLRFIIVWLYRTIAVCVLVTLNHLIVFAYFNNMFHLMNTFLSNFIKNSLQKFGCRI